MDVAVLLLSHGASVDPARQYPCTAVTLNSREGEAKAVQILPDHGADANAVTNDGSTALIWAA